MNNMYQGRSGNLYTVNSNPMAKGGEGSIYEIEGYPDFVLKVFRNDRRTAEREEKLIRMVQYQLTDAQLLQVTWPQDVVYDQYGFAGYIMPRLRDNQNLNNVYATQANQFDLRHRIVIAYNLCVAIDTIHSIHQVCGDLNPQNICVDLNMNSSHALCVTLVDTDSYHIIDNGITYRCEVGLANYIAPEVQIKLCQGVNLRSAPLPTYTKETDLFALAVHIFSLLMNGCHPFACAKKTNYGYEHNMDVNDYTNQESVVLPQPIDNIKDGFFPFHQQKAGVTYPLYAPDFQALPQDLQGMFIRAFEDGYMDPRRRPTAEEWMAVLGKYWSTMGFDQCQNGHYFFRNNTGKCPFCEANQRMMQMLANASFANRAQNNFSAQQNQQQTAQTSSVGSTGNSFHAGYGSNQGTYATANNGVNQGPQATANNGVNQGPQATANTGYAQTGKGGFGANNYQKTMKPASISSTKNFGKLLTMSLCTSVREILLGVYTYLMYFNDSDDEMTLLGYTFLIFFILCCSRILGLKIGNGVYWENRVSVIIIDIFNCIYFSVLVFCWSMMLGVFGEQVGWNGILGCVCCLLSVGLYLRQIGRSEERNQRMLIMTPFQKTIYILALAVDAGVSIVNLVIATYS